MSFLSGLLGGSQTTNTSGSTSASATPTFSPQLQQLMTNLLNYSSTSMSNPTAALKPVENAGLNSINQTYATAPATVAKNMASRGYGSSGTMGDAMFNTGLARAGAVSNFEGGIATDAINQQNFGASLGEQLLNTGKGTSTTGTSNSTSTQTSTPGLGDILGSLASLLMAVPTGGGGGSSGGAVMNMPVQAPDSSTMMGWGD
jgi:hypothetical protein